MSATVSSADLHAVGRSAPGPKTRLVVEGREPPAAAPQPIAVTRLDPTALAALQPVIGSSPGAMARAVNTDPEGIDLRDVYLYLNGLNWEDFDRAYVALLPEQRTRVHGWLGVATGIDVGRMRLFLEAERAILADTPAVAFYLAHKAELARVDAFARFGILDMCALVATSEVADIERLRGWGSLTPEEQAEIRARALADGDGSGARALAVCAAGGRAGGLQRGVRHLHGHPWTRRARALPLPVPRPLPADRGAAHR